ncbi:MAG TPA: hypothetical protein VNS46_02695 [Nocardioides sp.]|nr:hypothetical protein [Nocardioides sp.]
MAYSFEKVQAAPVLATVRRLEQRIEARFPGRGGKIWQKISILDAARRDGER